MKKMDIYFGYLRKEWKKWKETNPKIVKAVEKYNKKQCQIEGSYRGICE